MKRFRSALLAFGIMPALIAAAAAEEIKRSVTVTGAAEVRVVPDEVLVQMSVESRNRALMPAVNETNKAVAAAVALAKGKLKVPVKHVQTDYIQIRPHYVSCRRDEELEGKCDPTQVAYYRARRGIQIRLRDLDKFGRLLTESLQGGITYIEDVEFRTTELRKHRDKARALAAKAAREKAQAAAEALGAKLGPVTTISVDTSSWGYGRRRDRRRSMAQNVIQETGSGGEGAGLELGQISITARMSATFALE